MENETESKPLNVLQRLTLIKQDLAKIGIGKDKENPNQRYMFRSVDQMYNVIGPLFAKYGVHTFPHVKKRKQREYTSSGGGRLIHVVLDIKYEIVCDSDPGAGEIAFMHACVQGEALDSGDKATNKAMTAAYKYMLIQVLCIPLEAIDIEDEQVRIAGFSENDKAIYDEIVESGDALEYYIFARTAGEKKLISLYNSFPQGQKVKLKKVADRLMVEGLTIYQAQYLDPLKELIAKADSVGFIQLKQEIDPRIGQFINADLSHDEKEQAQILLEVHK